MLRGPLQDIIKMFLSFLLSTCLLPNLKFYLKSARMESFSNIPQPTVAFHTGAAISAHQQSNRTLPSAKGQKGISNGGGGA